VNALVGQRIPRVEGGRPLTGRGRFVDDVAPADAVHACILRPHGQHRRRTGAGRARVVAAYAGRDLSTSVTRLAGFLELPVYDDEGQYLADTLMDDLLPTAEEIPAIEIHRLSASGDEFRPLCIGESGPVESSATLTNAIADALRPVGVRITRQHLPPSTLVDLIEAARTREVTTLA
jgi:CO/xanthine dehydrogenase Mo-binding subunit